MKPYKRLVVLDIETNPKLSKKNFWDKKRHKKAALNMKENNVTLVGAYLVDKGKYVCADNHKKMISLLKLLDKLEYGVIAHNAKFDVTNLAHHFGVKLYIAHDTSAMIHALDNSFKVGLKANAVKYLGVEDWGVDEYGPSQEEVEESGFDYTSLKKYLKKDVMYTYKLLIHLSSLLINNSSALKLYKTHYMPVVRAFVDVELRGIYFDKDKAEQLHANWGPKLVKLEKGIRQRVHEVHGYPKSYKEYKTKPRKLLPFNFTSPKQMSDLLYNHLDLEPKTKTKTGNAGTGSDALKYILMDEDTPDDVKATVRLIQKYKKYLKLYNDFLTPILHENVPNPSFRTFGTETGRTSCSNPNIQQVPREKAIRSLITARDDDHVFVEIDYSQIELRVAAHLSGDREMLKAYTAGEDLHKRTAQMVSGSDDISYEARTKAKAINFGLLYGMSPATLAESSLLQYGAAMSLKEAEDYSNNFYKLYKGYTSFIDRTKKRALVMGYAESVLGRVRSLPSIRSSRQYLVEAELRKAVNTPVQSLASDILVSCVGDVDRVKGVNVVGTVHDAILMEVRKDHLEDSIKEVVEIMENPPILETYDIEFRCPIVADVSIGPWGSGVDLDEYLKSN